jgi:hypothetical protein
MMTLDSYDSSDSLFKPDLVVDDSAIAPPAVQLKASDKSEDKRSFKKRIRESLMPQVLDVNEIDDEGKSPGIGGRSALSHGKGSPLFSGKNSGKNSGFTGRDRVDMVFAETPLWCGAPFGAPFSMGEMPSLDDPFSMLQSNGTSDTIDFRAAGLDDHRVKVKHGQDCSERHSSTPSTRDSETEWQQPDLPVREQKPQVQYVPVPVPMGVESKTPGSWSEHNPFAPQKQAPMMVPVPVPVPVPMGCADGGQAALNASLAAAVGGQDLYSAALSMYLRGAVPQVQPPMMPVPQPVQPPPGFVAPPGYKFVPAAGPSVSDVHGYPQSWPFIDMNMGRQDFAQERKDIQSVPDLDKKRQPSTRGRSNNNGKGGKVFVGGLSPCTTVDMLRAHFSEYGNLIDVSVIKDPNTKLSRGFGFVEFENGIPSTLLKHDHVIDKRKCGVKPYTYEV